MFEIIPNWHPMFVHFTVALICVSGVLFVLSRVVVNWRLEDQWLATAYWMLWIGALISVGTVLAGWDAFNTVEHDTASHEAMLEHRNLALVTFIVIIIMTIWSVVQYVKEHAPSFVFLVCMVLSVGMVASTAWHGAELVYRHGLGVMSLPQKEDHVHDELSSDGQGHADVVKATTADVAEAEAATPGEDVPAADDEHSH